MAAKLLSILAFVSVAYGHGRVMSPPAREPGTAFKNACGDAAYNTLSSDPNGNEEGVAQQLRNGGGNNINTDDCFLSLCKGLKFEDNVDNVQSYTPGQSLDFSVQIAAPHTGIANVSVVDTTTNSVVGTPLIEWDSYASTARGVGANETAFSVTLPDTLPAKCATAGNCVLQWWWHSDEASQTYSSCIDFTSGGSGGSAPAPAPEESSAAPVPTATSPPVSEEEPETPAPTTAAPVTTAAPTTSAAPVATPPATCTRRRVRRNSPAAKRYHAKRALAAERAARRV